MAARNRRRSEDSIFMIEALALVAVALSAGIGVLAHALCTLLLPGVPT